MLRRVAIFGAVGLVVLAGVAFYLWRQATALPDWYEEERVDELRAEEPPAGAPPRWVAIPVEEEEPSPQTPDEEEPPPGVKAKRYVLRNFHRRGGADQPTAIEASRATYDGKRLEAGVVLDLSRVPKDKLTPRDKALYERAVEQFPGLTRRNVYVGLEDRPVREGEALRLGEFPKVRVGNLRYDLDDAARRLGMTEAELRREFDRELARLGLGE